MCLAILGILLREAMSRSKGNSKVLFYLAMPAFVAIFTVGMHQYQTEMTHNIRHIETSIVQISNLHGEINWALGNTLREITEQNKFILETMVETRRRFEDVAESLAGCDIKAVNASDVIALERRQKKIANAVDRVKERFKKNRLLLL